MPIGQDAKYGFGPWALLGAAVAWPSLFGFVANFTHTPLERALLSSWCGVSVHAEPALFGHCAACWTGSALLALAGAALLMRAAPARARAAR